MHGSNLATGLMGILTFQSLHRSTAPGAGSSSASAFIVPSNRYSATGQSRLGSTEAISSLRAPGKSMHIPTISSALSASDTSHTDNLACSETDDSKSPNAEPSNLIKTKRGDLILKPLDNKGDVQSIVLMPGAATKPKQYLALAQELQKVSPASLWVGIAKYNTPLDLSALDENSPFLFMEDYTSPITINTAADQLVNAMRNSGMENNKPFVAGHSLGGAFLHHIAKKNGEKYAGLIHLSSFLPRRLENDHPAKHMPSLTISGDLDGLVSIMRIAESYYQNVERAKAEARDPLTTPVVVIEGANHGSFFEGTPSPYVAAHDLTPEVEHNFVKNKVAETIVNFIGAQALSSNDEAREKLASQLSETDIILTPLINALKLEGNYHLTSNTHAQRKTKQIQKTAG